MIQKTINNINSEHMARVAGNAQSCKMNIVAGGADWLTLEGNEQQWAGLNLPDYVTITQM